MKHSAILQTVKDRLYYLRSEFLLLTLRQSLRSMCVVLNEVLPKKNLSHLLLPA